MIYYQYLFEEEIIMGQYEQAWEERKGFLFSSLLIGGAIALVTTILMVANTGICSGQGIFGAILTFWVTMIVFSFIFVPTVAIIRLMGAKASGFAIGLLVGLWTTMISSLFDFGPGMILGIIEMFLFFTLFAIVAAGYSIYLPVSSIYYFIRSQMEKKAAAAA